MTSVWFWLMYTAFVYLTYFFSLFSVAWGHEHIDICPLDFSCKHTHTVTFLLFLALPKNEHHHVHCSSCHALPCECFQHQINKRFTSKRRILFTRTQAPRGHLMLQCSTTCSVTLLFLCHSGRNCFFLLHNAAKIKHWNATRDRIHEWSVTHSS